MHRAYDYDGDYFVDDYIRDMSNKRFKTEDEALNYSLSRLELFAREINTIPRQYIIRERGNPFAVHEGNIIADYSEFTFTCDKFNESRQIRSSGITRTQMTLLRCNKRYRSDKKIPIFLPIYLDTDLTVFVCDFSPYGIWKQYESGNSKRRIQAGFGKDGCRSLVDRTRLERKGRLFNIFPGFKARLFNEVNRRISRVSPEIHVGDLEERKERKMSEESLEREVLKQSEQKVDPILDYIFHSWASNNEEDYEYILSWLAMVVFNPSDLYPALVFIREGRDPLASFLERYVFGEAITDVESSPANVSRRIEEIADKKILSIVYDESSEGSREHSLEDDQFYFMIKRDHISTPNNLDRHYLHFIIFTKTGGCISYPEARRYAVFRVRNEKLPRLNQDDADNFVTFLSQLILIRPERVELINDVDIHNPRYTEAKRSILGNFTQTELYIEDIKSGLWLVTRGNVIYDRGDLFISVNHLYKDYTSWNEVRGSGKPLNKIAFSRSLSETLGVPSMLKYIGGRNIRVRRMTCVLNQRNRDHFDSLT